MSDKYLNESGLSELRTWIINKLQSKQDKLTYYITDAGTTSSWNYQKYSDGTYHAWRLVNATSSGSSTTKTVSLTLPSFNSGTNYIVNANLCGFNSAATSTRIDTISATGFRIVTGLQSSSNQGVPHAVSVWGFLSSS